MFPITQNELIYVVSCLIAIVVIAIRFSALRHIHRTRVGFSLSSLALCVMIWLLAYVIMVLGDGNPNIPLIGMYIVDYFVISITIILFYFSLVFTGCKGKWHWSIWLYPTIIFLVMYLPNLWGTGLITYQSFLVENLGYRVQGLMTPVGKAILIFNYGLSLIAVIRLGVSLLRVNPNFRKSAALLIVIILLPLLVSIGQTFIVFDRPYLNDHTPVLLSIGIVSLAIFIQRTKITNLCLLSRDQFFDDFLNAVIVIDDQGFVLDGNHQAGEIFQSGMKYLLGKQIRDFFPLDEKNEIRSAVEEEDTPKSYPWTNALHREFEVYTHAFINEYEDILGEVLTFHDVTEYNQLLNQTVQLSIRDSLTNAYNRRHFEALATKQFAHARRYSMPFSLLMLDMNQFKTVNDTYGHLTGDQVLVKAVEIFQREIRDADTVARYGGDEFVILMPNTDLPGAIQAAQRIMKHCNRSNIHIPTIDKKINLSVCIGLSSWHSFLPKSEQALTYEEMIKQADQALYFAKNSPNSDMAFYESGSCRAIPTIKN